MLKSLSISVRKTIRIAMVIGVIIAYFCVLKISNHMSPKDLVIPQSQSDVSVHIDDAVTTIQAFVPQYTHLNSIGIQIAQAMPEAVTQGMYLSILDDGFYEIASASTLISMMPQGAYYQFLVDVDLEPGRQYFIQLRAENTETGYPSVICTALNENDIEKVQYLTQDGDVVGNLALQADYGYLAPMDGWKVLVCMGFVLIMAVILLILAERIVPDRIMDYRLTTKTGTLIWNTAVKHDQALMWLFVGGFAVLYTTLIFNDNIWTDEAFTIDLFRYCDTIKEVCLFTATDVHPPLYYIILLPFIKLFGTQLQVMKMVSVLPMLLTMMLGIYPIRKHFGKRTALLYIIFLGTLPITMEYVVQVRMYTWALLFVTVCGIFGYLAYRERKVRQYIITGLAGTAAAYTHYFAFVAVLWIYGILFLFLIFRKKNATVNKGIELLKWLGMIVGSAILYLPWLPHMIHQVSGVTGNYWIAPVTKKVVFGYLGWFFETDLPYSALMMQILFLIATAYFVITVIRTLRNKKMNAEQSTETAKQSTAVFIGAMILFLTTLTGVILSRLIRPIFIIRYGIPCLGLLALYWSYSFSKTKKNIYILVICFLLGLGIIDYQDTFQAEYKSTTVPQMEDFFAQNLGEQDYVVYNYKTFDFIYQYYFDADKMVYVEDFDWDGEFDDAWFICTSYMPEVTQATLQEHGLQMTFICNYHIEHNYFALYRIRKV